MADITHWVVREHNNERVEFNSLYGIDNKKYFTMEINHSGIFTNIPDREYIHGTNVTVDFVDIEAFNIKYLEDIIKGIGYKGIIVCRSCKLRESLDYGIMPLLTNRDSRQFVKNIKEEGFHFTRSIYVECYPPYINVFYPQTYLHAPDNMLANMLQVLLQEDSNASVFKARRFFINKYGVEFDFIRLKRVLKLAYGMYVDWLGD